MERIIENKTFDEIRPGDTASIERNLAATDLRAWSVLLGDSNASAGDSKEGSAALATALLSSLAQSQLPGPGSAICSITLDMKLPVKPGTTRTTLSVKSKQPERGTITLDGLCADASGSVIANAILEVEAPRSKLRRSTEEHMLDGLVAECRGLKPMVTGVVHPCSAGALGGAVEAADDGLILPVLFGPEQEIKSIAEKANLNISRFKIVNTTDPAESAHRAGLAAGSGEVQALMKGSLHSDAFLRGVLDKDAKLRTGRLLSHCAVIATPVYARRIIVSDAALNIAPDTDQKRDICQNAIGLARTLGIETPKVAVLAAIETVNTKMPATTDGAILAKMADRKQIVGGIVDGPLDLDAAVDAEAAKTKNIESPVAGCADILLVPNIEAGNVVYKDLVFMADAQSAGLVVGARVPVILTSRADGAEARRFSAAVAVIYANASARDPSILMPENPE
ncbi:MAG: bifunctional enoyl-CoA hydratase/phosphate acetyltransferase [Rhodomicrobium sp.]